MQIHGEHLAQTEPKKTCDYTTFRSKNRHVRYCRYHFYYIFAKKGKIGLADSPYDNIKMQVG